MVVGPSGGDASLTRTVVESFFSLLSRNGFRDVGLSGAVVGCKLKPGLIGEGRLFAGEAVRLRKGLFEGSVVVMPGEDCLTGSAETLSVFANVQVSQSSVPVFLIEDETGACMYFGRSRRRCILTAPIEKEGERRTSTLSLHERHPCNRYATR